MQDIDNARSNHQIRNMHALAAAGKCLFCPDGLTFAKQQPVFKTKFWYVKPSGQLPNGQSESTVHVSSPEELEELHLPFVKDLTPSAYAKQLLLYVFLSQPHTGSNNKIQATFSPLRHFSPSNRSPSGHLQLSMHFGHSAHESFGVLKT